VVVLKAWLRLIHAVDLNELLELWNDNVRPSRKKLGVSAINLLMNLNMKILNFGFDKKILGKKLDPIDFVGERHFEIEWHNFHPEQLELQAKLERGASFIPMFRSNKISADGFVVSDVIRNLLSSYDLQSHVFYSIIVSKGKEIRRYWFLHFESFKEVRKDIDVSKSVFQLGEMLLEYELIEDNIKYSSYEEMDTAFRRTAGRLRQISPKKIHYKTYHKYDLFYSGFDNFFVVSDRLASELQKLDIKSIEISEYAWR